MGGNGTNGKGETTDFPETENVIQALLISNNEIR